MEEMSWRHAVALTLSYEDTVAHHQAVQQQLEAERAANS